DNGKHKAENPSNAEREQDNENQGDGIPSNEEENQEKEQATDDERSPELKNFIKHFEDSGIHIVKVSNVLHETIGAIDGVRLHINEKGEVAELYLFESDSADFEEM